MSKLFKCCFGKRNIQSLKKLRDITYADTQIYNPEITKGKVIKVYDGDTITIATQLPYHKSPFYRFSIRLLGIDCPEIRTSNKIEKEVATIARQRVEELIYNKIVTIENIQKEKYSRILATVKYKNKDISDILLKERLAVPYNGKTKICPENWMSYWKNGYMD